MSRTSPPTKTRTAAPASRPVPTTREGLLERFKDYPGINVLKQRLDAPGDRPALSLLLNDEAELCCLNTDHWNKERPRIVSGKPRCRLCGLPFRLWYIRWINAGEQGRWSEIKRRGYVPVLVNELADADEIADLHEGQKDRYVRRGDRGQDVLCKYPFPFFVEIQAREEDERLKAMKPKAVKRRLVDATAAAHGDEAGDEVDDMRLTEMRRTKKTSLQEAATPLDDEIEAVEG